MQDVSYLCTRITELNDDMVSLPEMYFVLEMTSMSIPKSFAWKTEKVLFYNTNLMYCLTPKADAGTMRETYLASQLGVGHQLSMPSQGDLVADGRWLFEVGGKNKGFSQIKGIDNSYVISDNIDIGHGNKIPLWLFGLLY